MEDIPLMALQEVGLTLNESKVYFALLELGITDISNITKKSGVHRVNVYDLIEKLEKKGLLSIINDKNKKRYQATNPKRLMEILKEREFMIEQTMPKLIHIYSEKKQKNQIYLLVGIQGIVQTYNMILEQKQTIYSIGESEINKKFLKHRYDSWNKKRLELEINRKLLYYKFTKKDKKKGWKDKTIEIKYIPNKFKTKTRIDICGNLVINLHPIKNSIMAIVIENEIIAESYKQFFKFMWEHAEN